MPELSERPSAPVEHDRDKTGASSWNPRWFTVVWYIAMTLVMLWLWQEASGTGSLHTIPYSEFKQLLAQHRIVECIVSADEINGELTPKKVEQEKPAAKTSPSKSATKDTAKTKTAAPATTPPKTQRFRTVRVEDPQLVQDMEKVGIKFTGVRPGLMSQLIWYWIIPIGIIWLVWWFAVRMRGVGQSILSIGTSKAKLIADTETGVTFDDVAGCDEAKFDLDEVVSFFKSPGRYRALGAEIPKGVLLVGPPGTGKTLLARAVAGEAHVPFFSISGSEFVEMFVGVGAARVRDLFDKAKSKAPCIIFIDELDAVGRQRGAQMGMVNDEREQTLNQLLVGLDGFEANEGVVVLAATNRPEVLDRALLRPGRFDRQVVVDAPDMRGRDAILRLHARGKPFAKSVDFRRIAQETPGFSGADLANVINEAALLAARHNAVEIDQDDIQNAVEKVVAGAERKSRRLGPEERRRVAYHETGHALVAAYCDYGDVLHKISIVPHGHAALGYTLQLPEEDRYLASASELNDRIKGLLGGRAAEEVAFSEVSTGPENDLEHATALARQMVCAYGMSQVIGLGHLVQQPPVFGRALTDGYSQRDCSEQTAREVDEEVKRILGEAYEQAKSILNTHHDKLDLIANELLKNETMDAATFKQLLNQEND